MTRNRYLPLENIDESFDSSSGDNVLQLERNVVAIKKMLLRSNKQQWP